MAEAKRVVTGFNHNVKHRGKVYHVQTEDSGRGNPHIITHLFVGGNILASRKTSYADIAAAENLAQVVRELMEEQHKEMLRNLVNGVYDDVDAAYGERAQHYQPGQLGGDAPRAGPAPLASAIPVGGTPPGIPPRPPTPSPRTPLPPEALAARAVARPPLHGGADSVIIGEDLLSEKTLDEVILSYLAEDLGEKK
jgi:hypothetical protein